MSGGRQWQGAAADVFDFTKTKSVLGLVWLDMEVEVVVVGSSDCGCARAILHAVAVAWVHTKDPSAKRFRRFSFQLVLLEYLYQFCTKSLSKGIQ